MDQIQIPFSLTQIEFLVQNYANYVRMSEYCYSHSLSDDFKLVALMTATKLINKSFWQKQIQLKVKEYKK